MSEMQNVVSMTEEQAIGELRAMLRGRGWLIVATRADAERKKWEKAFFDKVVIDNVPVTDEFVRGVRHMAALFLEVFPQKVKEFDANRALELAGANDLEPIASPYTEQDNPDPRMRN